MRALLSRKLPVVGNMTERLPGCSCRMRDSRVLAHDERARTKEATSTIAEAARQLECNTRSVRRLVESEWLRVSQSSRSFRVTGESIAEFKKQYVSLLSIARATKGASWAIQNISKSATSQC